MFNLDDITPDDYAPGLSLTMPEDSERVCLRNPAHQKLVIEQCWPNTSDWECYCEDCLDIDEAGELALAEHGLGKTPMRALEAYRVDATPATEPVTVEFRGPRKCWQQIWVPALGEWVSREVEINEEGAA